MRAPSGTVTFLFTDIEGSTTRWDRMPRAMQQAVRLHDELVREAIEGHGGHVFKTVGDAFCAAFSTPLAAANAALEAQLTLAAANFAEVEGLRVRMAVNTGTADERNGDYFGSTVNRVARLLSLAHGGQILLSGIAADLVREDPPEQAMLVDLGSHPLKDLQRPERVYQLVAPDLPSEFPELRSSSASRHVWLIPEALRTRHFTGRHDLLVRLRKQLEQSHRAVLSGLGGAGKTQTAIEYALRHRSDYPSGVSWVNAETPSGLTSGFVGMARALRLAGADSGDQEKVVQATLDWLNAADAWLLIFDNVENRRDVQTFFPESRTGDVLITSRDSVFAEFGIARGLEVGDMKEHEAVDLLIKRTAREHLDAGERAAASALAYELGFLPLALEQAAAYIAETGATFDAYLSAFRKRRIKLLDRGSGLVAHEAVSITWAENFEAVERTSAAAAEVLRIGAFVAPDAIPFEVFEKGAQALGGAIAAEIEDVDDLAMMELLRPLARYSLVRVDPPARTFSIHRLVQEIVRTSIGEEARGEYILRALGALNAALPEVEQINWRQFERVTPHVVAIAQWDSASKVLHRVGRRPFLAAGRYLVEQGRYTEALSFLRHVTSLWEEALGPDHPDIAEFLNITGVAHLNMGAFTEAAASYERGLAICERAVGPEHTDVARLLNNLATVHSGEGRDAEAQPLYERVLEIFEKALGSDDPLVATALNNIGDTLFNQGRVDEAEALHLRALDIRRRALGLDHTHTALSMRNLAGIQAARGNNAEAESLHEQALDIRRRVLGAEHVEVADSLEALADLRANVDPLQAEGLYLRAQEMLERLVLASHPSLASIRAKRARLREAASADQLTG